MEHTHAEPVPVANALAESDRARLEMLSLNFAVIQTTRNSLPIVMLSTMIVLISWHQINQLLLLSWLSAVTVSFVLRNRWLAPAKSLQNLTPHLQSWSQKLYVSTYGCGLVIALGAAAILAQVHEAERMLLSVIFAGWLAGAMSSLGTRTGLYAGYAALVGSGVACGWLISQSPHWPELLILFALFVLTTAAFSRSFSKQVHEGIAIRFENERLIRQLELARNIAEETSAAKSRFLAVASHDLRQPLHVVTLLNGLLVRPQAPEKIAEISRQMGKALDTLERMFSSVLDYSKIEAGKVVKAVAWFQLEKALDNLRLTFTERAMSKGLSLIVTAAPYSINSDQDLFERILGNLIDNALKFTDAGHIRIECIRDPGGLTLTVTDTGPGVATNLREEIFKEYFQVEVSKQGVDGLGLGLATVRQLCRALDFQVHVEDGMPRGAKFVISVPDQFIKDCDALTQDQPVETEMALRPGFTVLCADDDSSTLHALKMLLEDWGCQVLLASNKESFEAHLACEISIDAILSDYDLGNGLTGISLIAAARQQFEGISAAIMTGDISKTSQTILAELEYPVLRKPVSPTELRELLIVFSGIA